MHPRHPRVVLLGVPLLLSSCTIGAYLRPLSNRERQVNGLYQGVGSGLTGRVLYRLTVTIMEREGRASAVLTNLESRKTYPASGTFKPTPDGGELALNLYENGHNLRATLSAELHHDRLTGTLKTVLLGKELLPYKLEMNKVLAS